MRYDCNGMSVTGPLGGGAGWGWGAGEAYLDDFHGHGIYSLIMLIPSYQLVKSLNFGSQSCLSSAHPWV